MKSKKNCFLDKNTFCTESCKAWEGGECKFLKVVDKIGKLLKEGAEDEAIFCNQYSPPEVVS